MKCSAEDVKAGLRRNSGSKMDDRANEIFEGGGGYGQGIELKWVT